MFGLIFMIGFTLIGNWREFFCKTCKEGRGKYVYATDGSSNIKISGLQDHTKSIEHKKTNMGKVWRKTNFKKTSNLD